MQWVVAFNGSRDAYQVPIALAERDNLEGLVTDWYTPLDRRWCRIALGMLPGSISERMRRRYRQGLPSNLVKARALRAAYLGSFLRNDAARDALLGEHAGRMARNRGAGILSYSYYAHAAFEAYGSERPGKVLFQVQAHPMSVRRLLAEEATSSELARTCIRRDLEFTYAGGQWDQLCDEPLHADRCLVSCSYTKRTLIENGVDAAKVRVVPYGVDTDVFHPAACPPDSPFRVLFVGQLTHKKGLAYLLEAWRRLGLKDAELVLVGRGRSDAEILALYEGHYTLRGPVNDRDELRTLYQSSHVCCVPSLSEGFGLVYLESLACGTPIIASRNSGAPDVITDGQEGFIVGIRDVDALMQRLLWCYEHRGALADMRERARTTAERFTWPAFRRALASTIADLQ